MESIVRCHFLYFLDMAELKERQLEGAEKLQAFIWFIKEQPNLLAAMRSALSDKSPDGDRAAHHLETLLHQNWHRYGVHLWADSKQ